MNHKSSIYFKDIIPGVICGIYHMLLLLGLNLILYYLERVSPLFIVLTLILSSVSALLYIGINFKQTIIRIVSAAIAFYITFMIFGGNTYIKIMKILDINYSLTGKNAAEIGGIIILYFIVSLNLIIFIIKAIKKRKHK